MCLPIYPSGRSFRLIPTDSSPELVYLDGLEIRVEGRRMGRRILTREWTITDAGDGSAPFVGTLSFVQGEWMLDDRNASTPLILESQDSEALFPYIGQRILVSGFVVANQTVQIVSWRPLTDVRSLEP